MKIHKYEVSTTVLSFLTHCALYLHYTEMQVKSFDKCMAFHGNFSTLSKKNHGKTKIYKEHSPMVTFYNFSTKYTHKSLETASSIYHVRIIFRKTNISYPLIRTRMSAIKGSEMLV